MKVITTKSELRSSLQSSRTDRKRIGFVPTMGYLHEGHISLVKQAKLECDIVVMSIFVNPLQFGPNEDLNRYPRDFERDCELAKKAGVDYLFHPDVSEMYPSQSLTYVRVGQITEKLCGASRPGHFDGVATVVTKLFQIVQPDRAYFGLKDAQQVAVIEQMVLDLDIPVTIVPCEIVRESDGLALSSRNVFLTPEQHQQALILSKSLQMAKDKLASHLFESTDQVSQFVIQQIQTQSLAEIDYVDTLQYPSLESPNSLTDDLLIAVAVRFGSTRLIDNVLVRHNNKEC
ncbi:pantoate--beta-alanine ligase [Baia soyae]|uniref:Pantothenate synthetase n=1 Tax=Baia soyae TaxID=1544746 RepID=A0A4R2RZY9_9BACL|nr:pantoate--beta-alanine ligase [Baia soyae]TCP69104.1 pantoate--beta-alanine ligase [Baia soyae]